MYLSSKRDSFVWRLRCCFKKVLFFVHEPGNSAGSVSEQIPARRSASVNLRPVRSGDLPSFRQTRVRIMRTTALALCLWRDDGTIRNSCRRSNTSAPWDKQGVQALRQDPNETSMHCLGFYSVASYASPRFLSSSS
jgi:hypothetical protein